MAYQGFSSVQKSIEAKEGYSPDRAAAIAAVIGRKKYGAKKFNKAAAKGQSLKGARRAGK